MSRDESTPSPFGHKIRPRHRDRLAVVYIRQSTQHQVVNNRESADLQYHLRQRAVALGWADGRIQMIDDDQGISGTSVENRPGFQRLLAEVSLGHVGIVFGREMSRLSSLSYSWISTGVAVGFGEQRRHPREDAVGPAFDVPQRVVGSDTILDVEHVKQRRLVVGLPGAAWLKTVMARNPPIIPVSKASFAESKSFITLSWAKHCAWCNQNFLSCSANTGGSEFVLRRVRVIGDHTHKPGRNSPNEGLGP